MNKKEIPFRIKVKFYLFRVSRYLWSGLVMDIAYIIISIVALRFSVLTTVLSFLAAKIILLAPVFKGRFLMEVLLGRYPKIYPKKQENRSDNEEEKINK